VTEIRLVPISADQLRVLESLQRAFFGLASDVNRDLGIEGDDSITGGLFRIWSTLDVIATLWKEDSENVETLERWRRALAAIANDAPITIDETRAIAREALAAESHGRARRRTGSLRIVPLREHFPREA
jgi:hypothetical protein